MLKLLKPLLLILFSSFIGISALADADQAEETAQLERFLDLALLEIKKPSEIPSGDRIVFEGADGKRVAVYRSQLSQAISRALQIYYQQNPVDLAADRPEPLSLGSVGRSAASSIPRLIKGVPSFLMGLPQFILKDAPEFIKVKSTDFVQFGLDMGVMPAAFVFPLVVSTWVPYTIATEGIEFMFLGFAHVFCQVFQVIYWAGVGRIAYEFIDLDSLLRRSLAMVRGGVDKPLAKAINSVSIDRNNRSRLKRLFLESQQAIYRFVDFKKSHELSSGLQNAISRGGYWVENHAHRSGVPVSSSEAAVDIEVSQQKDSLTALALLYRLKSKSVEQSYRSGSIKWVELLKAKTQIGRRLREIRRVDSMLTVRKVAFGKELDIKASLMLFDGWLEALSSEVAVAFDSSDTSKRRRDTLNSQAEYLYKGLRKSLNLKRTCGSVLSPY